MLFHGQKSDSRKHMQDKQCPGKQTHKPQLRMFSALDTKCLPVTIETKNRNGGLVRFYQELHIVHVGPDMVWRKQTGYWMS